MLGLLSIHDVMPGTLSAVKIIIGLLQEHQVGPVSLLVVPGKDWKKTDIAWLQELEKRGYNLAGHGCTHRSVEKKSFKHRIHSVALSKNAAEHLSQKTEQIIKIIHCSHQWFQDVGLKKPYLYVPPAWALGKISVNDLKNLPFRIYETLTGLYDIKTGRTRKLPLVGFEAESRLKACGLRISNTLNETLAVICNRPLRVAIHPGDLQLGLSADILPTIARCHAFVTYNEIIKCPAHRN